MEEEEEEEALPLPPPPLWLLALADALAEGLLRKFGGESSWFELDFDDDDDDDEPPWLEPVVEMKVV